jgi:hypothetical protein
VGHVTIVARIERSEIRDSEGVARLSQHSSRAIQADD